MLRLVVVAALAAAIHPAGAGGQGPPAPAGGRISIVYDAFGASTDLVKDWGFAALVEYGGRRILFDTGNDATIFEKNVDRLGIDLGRLDAAVISHRHGDHTTGLSVLTRRNRGVIVYAPPEGAFFRSPAPTAFFAPHPDLPRSLRYFDGAPPPRVLSGTPWEDATFEMVPASKEIFPGMIVLTTRSEKPGTLEMHEAALAIRTPSGLAVVVGCAHPGVEKILEQAARIDPRIHLVTGGFHLVLAPPEEVRRVAAVLDDTLKVERVAPGHCTSELGFATFRERFKERFVPAGVGATLTLP